MKFRIKVEDELYYPSSENKGADQLRSYWEVDWHQSQRLRNSTTIAQSVVESIVNPAKISARNFYLR